MMHPGDTLLCYLRGVSKWVGALEVLSDAFWKETRIWEDAIYPCRVSVKSIIELQPNTAVSAKELLPKLRLFSNLRNPQRWGMALRTSPRRLADEDGRLILNELTKAASASERRPKAAKRTPRAYHDQITHILHELGEMEGRVSEREYRIDGERIDVVWKRIEVGNPYVVFEVQIGGNFYQALAKLKHAWDKWNSRPFLVTTTQYRKRALEWVRGSFHEIERELNVVDCEKVVELYEAVKKTKSLEEELGIY
jgi:predicted RNA-binding protein